MQNVNRGTREERRHARSGVSEEGQRDTPGTSGADEQSLDLNHATAVQLAAIDGVGEQLAQALVQHRVHYGHFTSWEQLAEVPGLGQDQVAALRRAARLEEHPRSGDERAHRSADRERGGTP